jgi:phage terminase large subunit GpA-like protein
VGGDRRHGVADCECGELFAPGIEERTATDDEPACPQFDQVCEHRIEVALGGGIQDMEVQPEGMSCRLRGA